MTTATLKFISTSIRNCV